jgi:asparagine synthase (glutamine-hydrolysing)
VGCVHWFVVLPDCARSQVVFEKLSAAVPLIALHASGRPWLLGDLPEGQATVVTVDDVRLAVLGHCPSTVEWLRQKTAQLRTLEDLDGVAAGLRGSCHLALSVDGQTRVQGTVSGLRRVFHTNWGGMAVAADRADVLAALAGLEPDERWLAANLLTPTMPHPLTDLSAWHGIVAVPADSALFLCSRGQCRVRRWWQPPAPTVSLAEGASVLREALSVAVADRVRLTNAEQSLGADLSGGMDSTTLCFLANRSGARTLALTLHYRDPANDDGHWADLAARDLSQVSRLVLSSKQVPAQFSGTEQPRAPTDAPSPLLRGGAELDLCASLLSSRGIGVHLAGHGGDEVVQAPPVYLGELFRRHPLIAARHLRGHRARYRWPIASVLRGLADRRSYGQWLAGEGRLLSAPEGASAPFGWEQPLRLAPWATPHAAQIASSLLREAAASTGPLAPTRGQHQALHRIRIAAQVYRLMVQDLPPHPSITLPFLDDHVVQACLAVRLEERGTPWAFKPLLTAAMRGIVPDSVLTRTTKATTDADFYWGLQQHRRQLLTLVDNSQLARRGLIHSETLRTALLAPQPRFTAALEDTLACESWLTHQTWAPGQITITAKEMGYEHSIATSREQHCHGNRNGPIG